MKKSEQSQQKISSFFSKSSKSEVRTKENLNNDNNSLVNKKRKLVTENQGNKSVKLDDSISAGSARKSNVFQVKTSPENANSFRTSPNMRDINKTDSEKLKPKSPQKHSASKNNRKEKENVNTASKAINFGIKNSHCDTDSLADFYGIDIDEKKFSKSSVESVESSLSTISSFNIESLEKNVSADSKLVSKPTKAIPILSSEKKSKTEVDKAQNDNTDLQKHLTDDFDDLFGEEWNSEPELDLSDFKRCKVIEITKEAKRTILLLMDETSNRIARVHCSGYWKEVDVQENEIIAIQAVQEAQEWVVDNSRGFIVVKPDLLISGTTIVGSLFCSRKAVLMERFRKMESLPYFKSDQAVMTIGSLVHQMLQQAICREISSLKDVTNLVDEIMKTKDTANYLYSSDLPFDECRKQMMSFAPKVFNFIQHYMKGNQRKEIQEQKENFRGQIYEIRDIEENIWLPTLGVKGKIDVTVDVKINSRRTVMPLEVKTGRPSFSLEHKGQIILYIMMMGLKGQKVDTGLLLYIRENIMQEVKSGHPERRDLVLLRNTLAHYFHPLPIDKNLETELDVDLPIMNLPEPINHHSACKSCLYNTICSTFLSKDKKVTLSSSHPLKKVSERAMQGLKQSHIDYVVRWVSLLQLEEAAQFTENRTKDLWTISPEKRELKGTCISNLEVIGDVAESEGRFEHIFFREQLKTDLTEDDYVIVSTDSQINISTGFVCEIKEDCISVTLDKNITKCNPTGKFHLDKYSFAGINALNYANLGGLLHEDEICVRLREIVIDRKPATFEKKIPRSVIECGAKLLKDLNDIQQRAVLKSISANEYLLIKGMPGTGKTQTLVGLIMLLNKLGHTVLITAHTHSAVDNILLKLKDCNVDFLRLGSAGSAHSSLKGYTDASVTAKCLTPENLDKVYKSKRIVGVTALGSHHPLLGKQIFDFCVVDESAQTLQPTILRPLYNAKKFILAGDPDQLPPVLKSSVARKLGADESLFARLDSENNTVILTKQYRMNNSIMNLANKLTYCDKLKAGNEEIGNSTFSGPFLTKLNNQKQWKQRILSNKLEDSVVVVDTGCTYDLKYNEEMSGKFPQKDKSYTNVWEAGIIKQLTDSLLEMGIEKSNIGVIAPYRSHVALLRKIMNPDIEVNTVDQYQGRDKEIIFYSCTKSFGKHSDAELGDKIEKKRGLEILEDHRRLTVAITRAKHKLIIVADKESVAEYTPFKKLFDIIGEGKPLYLPDLEDFSWEDIASRL